MITKSQKQYLKGLANTTKPIVMIGKTGLSDTIVAAVEENLVAHELIKIDVLKNCDGDVMEMALDLASATNSEIIMQIGRKIVLYRQNKQNGTIRLPK